MNSISAAKPSCLAGFAANACRKQTKGWSAGGLLHRSHAGCDVDYQLRRQIIAHQKGNLADDLLDYVTAGPKMRKWYGQAERGAPAEDSTPAEVARQPDPQGVKEGNGGAVLVTDADTPIGEQVVLQLILAGAEIRAIVRDTAAAKTSYGPFVTPVSLDPSNSVLLGRVLKGCGSVVCLGRAPALLQAAREAGVEHVVLLSAVGGEQGGFFASLFNRELKDLRDPAREQELAASGQCHTIVRVSGVTDTPGGQANITLLPASPGSVSGAGAGAGAGGLVSREDLAKVLVQTLLQPPQTSRTCQVVSLPSGVHAT